MNHPVDKVSTHPFLYYKSRGFISQNIAIPQKPVVIADDVWIGTNAVIMPGIMVGQGAIIGAGAVVTKNVPPYAIVGGVPAHLIRYRFQDDIIYDLCKIKWADWSDQEIKDQIGLFYDPEAFVRERNHLK